jgi:hypothetical protein
MLKEHGEREGLWLWCCSYSSTNVAQTAFFLIARRSILNQDDIAMQLVSEGVDNYADL